MTAQMELSSALSYRQLAKSLRDYARAMPCQASIHWRAESFRSTVGQPMTIRRARALNAVLEQCLLPLIPGELLVGVGNLGKCAPAHTVADDTLKADGEYLAKHIGRRGFGQHHDHHAPDYPTLLAQGFGGLLARTQQARAAADAQGKVFLESVEIALKGASRHMRRWAGHLKLSVAENSRYGSLLQAQADMLNRLASEPAATFHEAIQLVLMYHYFMQLDDRYAMAFGRMDQFLFPFYERDLAAGHITPDQAQDILDHLFAKITVDGDVQNIALGGVKPLDGSDATNDLSFMILEACQRVGLPGGNCTARIHKKTPPAFIEKCAEVVRSGIGYPAVYNDDIEIPALVKQGYALEHARDYCFAGCIEVFIPGKQAPWSDSRFNAPLCLSMAIFNGLNLITGQQEGPATPDAHDFEGFYQAFITQIDHRLRASIEEWNRAQRHCDDRPEEFTSPLMSALTDDCLARARDVSGGGAHYPGNCGYGVLGLATVADSLAAVKRFVFDQRRFSLEELRAMLRADFAGFEPQRQMLLRGAPKYGNDDAEVDALAVRYVEDVARLFEPYRTPMGGRYWVLLAANVSNIGGGAEVCATPDGRRSGTPLSDAGSPCFGRDQNGPTAALRSIGKIPYHLCVGGNVVNMKLHPSTLQGRSGLQTLACLIRTGFDLGASELQFNTTDRTVLQEAMKSPEQFEDLVVRVSGFSARFVWLSKPVQEDILNRTEHRLT